jgi:hypothetical protein
MQVQRLELTYASFNAYQSPLRDNNQVENWPKGKIKLTPTTLGYLSSHDLFYVTINYNLFH